MSVEAPKTPTEVDEVIYCDLIGNTMSLADYVKLDTQETQRCLKDLEAWEFRVSANGENEGDDQSEVGYVQPPVTIMGLIATQGEPDLSDFWIRHSTWYAHLDKEVLDLTLFELTQQEFIKPTRVEEKLVPEKFRSLWAPSEYRDTYYSLTDGAHRLNPNYAKIAEIMKHRRQVETIEARRYRFLEFLLK